MWFLVYMTVTGEAKCLYKILLEVLVLCCDYITYVSADYFPVIKRKDKVYAGV